MDGLLNVLFEARMTEEAVYENRCIQKPAGMARTPFLRFLLPLRHNPLLMQRDRYQYLFYAIWKAF